MAESAIRELARVLEAAAPPVSAAEAKAASSLDLREPEEDARRWVRVLVAAAVVAVIVAGVLATRDNDTEAVDTANNDAAPTTAVSEPPVPVTDAYGHHWTTPTWPTGQPPWGDGGQGAWQMRTGLKLVVVPPSVWGFMRAEDEHRIALDDPFGIAPVYSLNADETVGEQIGVWTKAGPFTVDEARDPDFDVRQLLLDQGQADYVFYLEHKNEPEVCAELVERYPESHICD